MSPPMVIAWRRYQRRSEILAELLGAQVQWRDRRSPWRAARPLDYALYAANDIMALMRGVPPFVIVQSPPHVAAVAPWMLQVPYVLDAHNAQFQSGWRNAPGARRIARSAKVIVTHTVEADRIARTLYRGAHTLVLHDPIRPIPRPESMRDWVFIVASVASDEPIDVLLEMIASMPNVHFATTAPLSRMPRTIRERAQRLANLTLLGFLELKQYEEALASSRAVLVLTTRRATQPSGACEALSACRPLVVSRTSTTRALFGNFAVLVDNTRDSLIEGVREALGEDSRKSIAQARDEWMRRSEFELERLLSVLPRQAEI